MICSGCWVQGFRGHVCYRTIWRPTTPIPCICNVEKSCRAWSTAGVPINITPSVN